MLKIYNTLTQKKELFKPIEAGKVKMYVCGMTVYDYCHLGHGRMLIAFDVIARYLSWCGFQVTYIRNITDVDDKIINRANENKEDIVTLTSRFIQAMHDDAAALNLLTPTKEPRATQHISHIIELISKLLTEGYAYIVEDGDIYYSVRKFKNYGALSRRDIDKLASGVRVEINDVKKDPLDFVLWKLAKVGEPSWESPWGRGRPGWHIECSAMSLHFLGAPFDIHGGGVDLVFPHHENELAQSEAAIKKKFVNYWLHNGHVKIQKEKMSKSLNNFFIIKDLLKKHSAEALRYFLIAGHYRSPLDYSELALIQAKNSLERLYNALRDLPSAKVIADTIFENRFKEAMDDDFNVPIALSVLFDLAHEIQRLREKDLELAAKYGALLKYLGGVLGILQTEPTKFFQSSKKQKDIKKIEDLIGARNEARENKEWAEADRLRAELTAMSVILEDGPNGTTWRYEE